ncbi:hypothetical protein [Nocardioides jensenii]|uniref:hypothetical protein n=1 Tax=Nocardioides jensenii TaxID=1843 RepID=UPI00082F3358|nr:hypothetical protein [Nocardioides jensenii]
MSSEHKRPLFAFVVIALGCALFMGYTFRAEALIGVARGDVSPRDLASQVISAGAVLLDGDDAPAGRSPGTSAPVATAPQRAQSTERSGPSETRTARPVARAPYLARSKASSVGTTPTKGTRARAAATAGAPTALRRARMLRAGTWDHHASARADQQNRHHSSDRGRAHRRGEGTGHRTGLSSSRGHRTGSAHGHSGHRGGAHHRGHHRR